MRMPSTTFWNSAMNEDVWVPFSESDFDEHVERDLINAIILLVLGHADVQIMAPAQQMLS